MTTSDLSRPLIPETTMVDTRHVWCDGSGDIRSGPGFRPASLGHPRVYMQIDAKGYVDCGYCDRHFVLEGGAADSALEGATQNRTLHEFEPGDLPDIGPGDPSAGSA